MKKQIIAAAVAATMTSVALADISITGTTKINYTNSEYDSGKTDNAVKNETDLKVVGKNGDTQVVISIEADDAADNADGAVAKGLDLEDVYMTTKVGDVAIKVGDWDNGNNFIRASGRTNNQLQLNTNVGPVSLQYNSGHQASDDKITVGTDLGPVAVKYVKQNSTNSTSTARYEDYELTASTNIQGVGIAYHLDSNEAANADKTSLELTGKLGEVGVKFVSIEADSAASADGDTWAGDFEGTTSGGYKKQLGADIMAVELSTTMAGNSVKWIHTEVEADTNVSSTADADNNKFIVTRPLASGATFEATYTTMDVKGDTANSGDTLDLELSVKF
jgi:hypothetical protein